MKFIRYSLGLLILLSMLLTACSGTATPAVSKPEVEAASGTGTTSGSEPVKETGKVFILGPFGGGDEAAFNKVIDTFKAQNPGIEVVYTGSGEFDTLINVRVEAGDPPDIAAFPQPGAVGKFAREGHIVPLWPEAISIYDKNYSPAWKELATVEGKVYGMFHRVNAKGWIWYNKPVFEAAGYKAPNTWEGLQTLTQQMKASGVAPWCDGIEASSASGWKGTDWIENILLRTQSLDVYDRWSTGEFPFDSSEVRGAFKELETIWMDPTMVYGGAHTIALTNVPQAAQWLFTNPPKCWLHMQGSFVTGFFQDEVKADLDNSVGVFMMPMINVSLPTTLEIGGDQFVVFKGKDRPEVRKFIEFLGTADSAKPWAQVGGGLFPHKAQDYSWYQTELERTMVKTLVDVQAARFDGSDAMPSKLNLAFWKGITDWISGASDLDTILKEIDESRE
jgi:alpha-glucoside transport system substrate-binding protein